MTEIVIRVIEHDKQRYATIGDWWFEDGSLQVRVSYMNNWRYESLVALHEVVEALLCKRAGVTTSDVDAFDMAHPELEDPGDDPRCPYRKQHLSATAFEQLMATLLDVDWQQYESIIRKITR